jgi:hypothetical protein
MVVFQKTWLGVSSYMPFFNGALLSISAILSPSSTTVKTVGVAESSSCCREEKSCFNVVGVKLH